MKISLIAAYTKNRVIGKENDLPWKLPNDMKRFKTKTMGHFMLMGRKTFESNAAPLPGRTSIVLTRKVDYQVPAGVFVVKSLQEAIMLAKKSGEEELFIIGGEEIFKLALEENVADSMYLTEIDTDLGGDAFFPEFDENQWQITEKQHFEPDEKNKFAYDFVNWKKLK
ncbi:MAG: dihydrofolate reductase [Verrucomicrobia bacterium]|nr:dihydrofolate reductase [Cytophagales bacterium]